ADGCDAGLLLCDAGGELLELSGYRHPAAGHQLGPDGVTGPHLPAHRVVAVVLPGTGDRHHHRFGHHPRRMGPHRHRPWAAVAPHRSPEASVRLRQDHEGSLMTAAVDHHAPVDQVDADPVLDVEGMSVEIRTISGTVRAVNEVSFAARRGETLALLGESGCGKSMTATALVGLLEPVADVVGGTATLGDTDLLSANRATRRKIAGTELAIVFQDALTALNPLYTVGTQLAEPFRIHQGMSTKDAKRKAVELMARVGIPEPET